MSDSNAEFRRQLVAWLEAPEAPPADDRRAWFKRLAARGLTAPDWPAECGGAGLDRERAGIVQAELRRLGVRLAPDVGRTMLGPVLREFGSDEQQRRFLPPIVRGEVRWCQGYSEPAAGSDLASLQMRAEDRGDHFVVNGQKIWTTGADRSDWIFCLVRSDPDAGKHEGIGFLLVDLRSEGVTITPLVLISGASDFFQVFFDDVRVPKDHLVGSPGEGWKIAKRLLQHERSMLASSGIAELTGRGSRRSLPEMAGEVLERNAEGRLSDAVMRDRIAAQQIEEQARRLTARRVAQESRAGEDAEGPASILKLVSSESNQRRYELIMELLGSRGFGWEGSDFSEQDLATTREWLRSRGNTIEGGTSEIQLNIIAKRVLGLPG